MQSRHLVAPVALLFLAFLAVGCAKGDATADDPSDASPTETPPGALDASTPPLPPSPPSPPSPPRDAGAGVDSAPACANTQTDPQNCGACGKACGAAEICAAGVCAIPCEAGAKACGATCVDTTTDLANCGSCGTVCAGGAAAKCTTGACSATLHVRAYIDGRSVLLLQGTAAHWHHYSAAAPGLWSGSNEATTLNTVSWTPAWPGGGENRDCNCDSQPSPAIPPVPARPQTVTLQIAQARDSVAIAQQPSAANGFAIGVEINDGPSGADWYDFTVSFATQ